MTPRRAILIALIILSAIILQSANAQQTLGSVSGVISDATGAIISGASVVLVNDQTAASRTTSTNGSGAYQVQGLPIGLYTVTITANGFDTEKLSGFQIQADRTAALVVRLKAGQVSSTIDVAATPQLDTVDTTNGYILDAAQIEKIPLGTGSFTQLATLSPGVHADLLADTGTNTGLGNQNIYANGQRLSSNTFTFNGVMTNNLFNGASSSQVTESRAVLNTGESFQSNGTIRTNTSIFDAIGEALPSPPQQTIAEERVNTSMFDAAQGATAGAHIDVTTKTGTNALHGSAYGNWETSALNANPFFNKQTGNPTPDLHRYVAGAELGGPIRHDKLFFYASYQYTRARDQLNSLSSYFAPLGITDDRSVAGLQPVLAAANLPPGTPIDPVALAFLQAKLPGGRLLIQSPADPAGKVSFIGPASKFQADQANLNISYVLSHKDTLTGRYYFQQDPSESPFSSTNLLGFPQKYTAGSQVFSLENTVVLSPRLTWEQKGGFVRMKVDSFTGQPFGPSAVGINLFGSPLLPGIAIRNANGFNSLNIGPTSNFANTGFSQNTFEGTSTLNYVVGNHSFAFGGNYDFTQLNIINRANQVATLSYNSIGNFLTGGPLRNSAGTSVYFQGASNRYYRSPQVGGYAQDQWRATPHLTITAGIRYDYDGGLYEKYGNLVNFSPRQYSYDLASDTIINSGLVVAGNNKLYASPGASKSTLTNRQWGIGPRIGLADSLTDRLVLRAGFGLYYDRGEYFTEFSPSAGNGFNGPFGVTLQPPFVQGVIPAKGATSENPFGTVRPPIDTNPADFIKNLSNQAALINGANPYLFGAYAANNSLPYTENWSLDLQYQATRSIVATLGYTGNHGVHQTVPVPFNQPQVATPDHPVNGQSYSYGYNATYPNGATLLTEPYNTSTGGNTDLRVPYIGYSPNSVAWTTVGWSHYDALLASIRQTNWHGFDFLLSYTWSHSLDAASGFGLFYNGNNPQNLASGYASSDYDRTHVTSFSFNYQVPDLKTGNRFADKAGSGWGLSGVATFQSGQPYNVYDFSGTVGSIFFASNDFLTNPVLPLAPGFNPKSARTKHSGAFVNPNAPNGTSSNFNDVAFTPSAFAYPSLQPGESGVPPCGGTTSGGYLCDTFESTFATGQRNIFRSAFQKRADIALFKETKLHEQYRLRIAMEVFNVTNTPSFDTPGNNFSGSDFNNPPGITPLPNSDPTVFSSQGVGAITNPIGSPRQVQFYGIFSF
ncbi:carboxypeptidase regulatory-like domain-containing protein [Tunturibacter empetritectus]|uniref:Carboxypeptidase regulatory-like domain-containing protein n=1 Tax=Tunturiibacter empetritectus TaxID=3069691 RepID=A0AAU7ZHW5_9BACT